MKPHFTALATALAATLTALAGVPLEWSVTPDTIAPLTVYRLHGETLNFSCRFKGFGELPFAQGADIRLWYQTNGMGRTWWSVPATVSSNVLSATFAPQDDPGVDRLALFFGAPSNVYASAVLRLRPSPGFTPNALPPPDVISWTTELASVRALIDYSPSNAALVATIEASARPVTRIVTEDGTRIMDATGSVFAVSSGPGVFVATNLFLMAPGVEFVFTNINAIAWGLVGGSSIFQQMIKFLVFDASNGRWIAMPPSFANALTPENAAIFNASFQSPTDTPFDAPSFGLYDRGFIGDASHLEGTFYRVTGSAITSLVDRVVFESDLPPLTNGLLSAESDPTVHAWAKASRKPSYNSDEVGAYSAQDGTNLSSVVSTWETYWDGNEVRVTVTNYDSSVHMPSLYLEQKIEDTDDYRVVWDERTRWESNEVKMAEMRTAINEKADRAWGFYDSHTGYYTPDDYTWISSPKIAIAGGLAYQRTITASGAIWVLASNGLVAETGGSIENGFFRIKDDEGNTTFEIVRGNKRTVGATAAGIKVTTPRNSPTTTIEIPYNVVSDVHPTLYGTVSLSSPEWAEIEATWTGGSGAWTAQVTSVTSTYFVKGEYEIGGETYIKNVAPISAEGGIYCTDGIHKVRPVYNSGTITWEVVTP